MQVRGSSGPGFGTTGLETSYVYYIIKMSILTKYWAGTQEKKYPDAAQ